MRLEGYSLSNRKTIYRWVFFCTGVTLLIILIVDRILGVLWKGKHYPLAVFMLSCYLESNKQGILRELEVVNYVLVGVNHVIQVSAIKKPNRNCVPPGSTLISHLQHVYNPSKENLTRQLLSIVTFIHLFYCV